MAHGRQRPSPMNETPLHSFKISDAQDGERLDLALKSLAKMSRKKVKSLLDSGQVFVNNRKVIIASWEVEEGNVIQVKGIDDAEELSADGHYLKVLYEDTNILVVEKEAGILCEKSPIATKPTLVAIINAYFKRKMPHLKHHYLGLVHRLDQDTSGIMVYSKTREANRITDQFKKHTIKRKYLAIVEGRVTSEQGKVQSYLKKSTLLSAGKKVVASTPEAGRLAITQYRLLERYDRATLLELNLNTGRTHQIRVQMASLGHPLVGDLIYGKDFKGPKIFFARQALHASYLCFRHPITGTKMEFRSELPRDMRRLMERLRQSS